MRIFSITGRCRIAATIFSSPPPQFGQCCRSVSKTRSSNLASHSNSVVNTHLIASLRTGAWVEHIDWWDELFVDPPRVVDGAVRLSEAPGLGLTLDEAAVRRLAV